MFDITTAKPMESQGFDIKTAVPLEKATPTTFMQNLGSDIGSMAKGIVPGFAQAASEAGKAGMDILTGSSLRNLMMPQEESSQNPVVSAMTTPSILNLVKATQTQAAQEAPKYELQNIAKTLYEHPLQNEITNLVMLATPSISGAMEGGVKAFNSPEAILERQAVIPEVKPQSATMLDPSEVLAKTYGMQKSTVDTLFDPENSKYIAPDMKFREIPIEKDAAESFASLSKGLNKAENQLYKNAGVTDETSTIWNKPILGDLKSDGTRNAPITPIESMRQAIEDYKSTAITSDKPTVTDASEIVDNIIRDSKFDENGNMNLSYGQAKKYSSKIYGLADKAGKVGDNDAQNLYMDMYNAAKTAKNSVPEIKAVSDKFSAMEDARSILENTFRGFGKEGREFRGEMQLFSKYKDPKNILFKQNIDKVGDILNQFPETKELADFSRKVKVMNAATDLGKAKIPTNGSFTLAAVRKIMPSPATIASLAARGAESGRIVKGSPFISNQTPFIGNISNVIKAHTSMIPSIVNLIKGAK